MYKNPKLTVDGLIIKGSEVLLIKRNITPFKNYWVLPGGHVEYGETVEQAIKREVKEETGLQAKKTKLLGVYSDPKRDPRYHSISAAFVIKSFSGKLAGSYESTAEKFFPLNKLPKKIGFDHIKIISDYKKWKRKS